MAQDYKPGVSSAIGNIAPVFGAVGQYAANQLDTVPNRQAAVDKEHITELTAQMTILSAAISALNKQGITVNVNTSPNGNPTTDNSPTARTGGLFGL